jgi:hypothetical protein
VVALVALAAGCSKEEGKAGAGGGDGKGVPSAILDGWRKANLTVSAFTEDKSNAIGPTCHSGTVSGVDVVWCGFAAEAEAKAAEAKGLAWVGDATGTALVSGKQLLAVVDRRAADPSGRTINAVTKAFK